MNKIENADTKIQVKKKVKSQSKGQQDKVNVTNLTVSSDSKISNQVMKIKNKKRKLDSSSASLQNALAATDNGDTNETKKILTSQTKGQQDKVNVKNLTVSSDSKISNQAIERQTRRKRELNKEGDAGDTNLTLSSESKISNQVTETNNNNKRKRESSVEDLEKRLPVANSSETKQVTKKVKLETETRQSTANDPNLTVSTDSKIVNQVMARQQRRRRESNKGGDGAVKHPFRCTVSGCSRKTSFPTLKGLFKHNNLYHRYLRCGACGEIKEVYDFNNSHLKNNPQCGEVDPLPWDKKKGVEAKDWKFRCTVKGCSTTFWLSSHSLWEHNRKYHQHVKCGACGQIDKLLEFNKSHLKNNPECAAVDPQPWDKNQGVEATDWVGNPFRCTVFGCSRKSSFSTSKALLHHTNKYHRYLRCGACGEIQELYEFNKFHLKNNPQCGEVDPLPWDKKNGVEAKDWVGKLTYAIHIKSFKCGSAFEVLV
ncbi:unnamed protein product [Orchesella dallaii]|uniref:C2H2-type domain-containing protein n=1 Tax=Orchesella dallaii TaxID=48710 RepID=A0ABP1PQV4_9HEXA